jgi:hypothetical protein
VRELYKTGKEKEANYDCIFSLLTVCKYRVAFEYQENRHPKVPPAEALAALIYLEMMHERDPKDTALLLCLSDAARELAWLTKQTLFEEKAREYMKKAAELMPKNLIATAIMHIYQIQCGLREKNLTALAKHVKSFEAFLFQNGSDPNQLFYLTYAVTPIALLKSYMRELSNPKSNKQEYWKLALALGHHFNSVNVIPVSINAFNDTIRDFEFTLDMAEHLLFKEGVWPQ